MIRVLFGHEVFDGQTVEGPSRYFVELIRHLPRVDVQVRLALRETDNVYLRDDPQWARQIMPVRKRYVFPSLLGRLAGRTGLSHYLSANRLNRRLTIDAMRKGAYDVFHPTYYEPYFLRYLAGRPYVLTVHDMIHELFPAYVKPGNPTSRWKRKLVDGAAHIIAVSESTKHDLVRLWQISPDRVTVVHHGVGAPFANPVDHSGGVLSRLLPPHVSSYLLYVGSRQRYKNFSCVVRALTDVVRTHPNLTLVCVGGGTWTTPEHTSIRRLGLRDRLIQVEADDGQLAALYQGAKAFVFPSLYEGFGMPILEAFACGCPVLCSRTAVFAEVADTAALTFDPQQPAEAAHLVQKLLASVALQEQLRREGRQRARLFTWEQTAAGTRAVYERVLAAAVR